MKTLAILKYLTLVIAIGFSAIHALAAVNDPLEVENTNRKENYRGVNYQGPVGRGTPICDGQPVRAHVKGKAEYNATYAAATATEGAVLEAAVKAIDAKVESKENLIKALRATDIQETVRGPVKFDQYGNVIGNVYIRRTEKKGGKYVNTVIHTYPNVSQFWTYKPAEFLKNPVYSRDWPPAKNLES